MWLRREISNGSGGVVEETTKNKGGAGKRVGGKGTRGTSKKQKQQWDSPESADDETKAEASVTERTKRTLKEAEVTQSNRNVLESTGIPGQQPGESNYTKLWCNHKARARPTHEGTDHRRNSHRGEQENSSKQC